MKGERIKIDLKNIKHYKIVQNILKQTSINKTFFILRKFNIRELVIVKVKVKVSVFI